MDVIPIVLAISEEGAVEDQFILDVSNKCQDRFKVMENISYSSFYIIPLCQG